MTFLQRFRPPTQDPFILKPPKDSGQSRSSPFRHASRVLALLGLAAFALLAAGCYNISTGTVEVGGEITFKLPAFRQSGGNAVQVFTEMHYQPSYRIQEPPRLLPPVGSVPLTGAEVIPTSLDEYRELRVPARFAETYDPARAQRLYEINCQVCHGANLDGQGPIMQIDSARLDNTAAFNRGPFPADLTSDVTRNATNGELFGFISGGGRQGLTLQLAGLPSPSSMPEYRRLLSEEDRWMLVQFLRGQIGP